MQGMALRKEAIEMTHEIQQVCFLRDLLAKNLHKGVPPVTQGGEVDVQVVQIGKNKNKPFWVGPSKVVGTDGRLPWVQLPTGKVVHVHRNQIRLRKSIGWPVKEWKRRKQR